mmetsp:Transcript_19962/g.24450  ORF Transcript_19962/g.24450 Transcript_19962/m.24450 type:complete len:320 (-) Transcript_19962:150-1109(-)
MVSPSKPGKGFRRQSETVLLISEDCFKCTDEKGEKGPLPPSGTSVGLTVTTIVVALFAIEHIVRHIIATYFQHLSTSLEVEQNRQILARHIGVDTFSCIIVACWGISNMSSISELLRHVLGLPSNISSGAAPFKPDDIDSRLYTYRPCAFRILLFFLAYQIKNLYDTIVWADGPEFIFHHILASATAVAAMHSSVGHYYCIFFMGISETSTGILCLLANFDEHHGVIGLEQDFPLTRLVVAAFFVVSFIAIRVIVWPIYARWFWMDVSKAVKRNSETDTPLKKKLLRCTSMTCAGLSALQVLWLGEIFRLGYAELQKSI